MKVLIADDEPIARQILRELLEEIEGTVVCGEAADGKEAVSLARQLQPDVMLLDLYMPGLDGFQVKEAFPGEHAPLVIFVTAYERHALQAFDAGAVDYVLKPVRKERLEAALQKARSQLAGKMAPKPASFASRKIVGRLGNDLHLLDPSEVIAFQAQGDTVFIITAQGRYYANHTLKALEQKLPAATFRRVHRSTIINTDQIRKISPLSSKRWLLRMANGMEVIVSKRLSGVIREETDW
ncbi:MAG: LytTR family DNA-binding domain-containing protein [Bryobacteraceae bacterium]|nr:LytTR family DNA-binding domain-containing protein [Bryobacteraceae bacterium]MDW8378929.1 LytTR family DNA-binding domain-containing protein [Bryobacterales bacterium]